MYMLKYISTLAIKELMNILTVTFQMIDVNIVVLTLESGQWALIYTCLF